MRRKLRDHIEKFHVFTEIARARSFHTAAKGLRLSQPTLSHTVRLLEDSVGKKFFVRSHRGVELTEPGRTLLSFAERLLSEVEGIETRIRHPDQPMAGHVSIGTYRSLTSYLLPKFLIHMTGRYDGLTLGLSTLRSAELADALLSAKCHLVIGTTVLESRNIIQVRLFEDSFGLFSAANPSKGMDSSYLEGKGSPSGHGFRNRIICPSGVMIDREKSLDALIERFGLIRDVRYGIDNFESVLALVREGLGIGVLPWKLAESDLISGNLVEARIRGVPYRRGGFGRHSFFASYLSEDQHDVRITAVARDLAEYCRDLSVRPIIPNGD